ncbi:MAG: hypothetical protein WD557_10730 [Dehalococcoidia bacterium]
MEEALTFAVIAAVRLLVPLTVLRWPFWGGLACIAADVFDSTFQDVVGVEPLEGHYHDVDKVFDLYYLAFEAWVARGWLDSLARVAALVLFGLRVFAVLLFELTEARWLFFAVGPNIFENFYLFVAGMLTINAAYRIPSKGHLAAIIVFVGAPKVLQEYAMHYREAQTHDFVTEKIFRLPW